jgi:signal transduction histidine kinase
MRWKVTLQFLVIMLIIAIAGNFINAVVTSYFFYPSDVGYAVKVPVTLDPKAADVKQIVRKLRSENGDTFITPEIKNVLVRSNAWIQIINKNGKEIENVNKPVIVKSDYTPDELSPFPNIPLEVKGYDVMVSMTSNPKLGTQFTYIIGTPRPKITVSTLLYSIYSYLTDWGSPKSSPKVVSALLTVLMALILGYIFARNLTKPVIKITDGIAALSGGDYNVNYKEKGLYKEVHKSLNNMVTALQSSETVRKRTEKMREEWIINISHDLKTPLASIKGYGELLLEPDFNLSAEERKKYSEVILKKSEYIENLLNDLKLTQRLKNDLIPLNKSNGNLVELLRDIVINLLNDPGYQNRKVFFDPDEETIIFNYDSGLMQRALTNIIYNAVVHNPDDTVIIVKVSANNGICIDIEDNGNGISEEDQKSLFERYYRGTNTDASHPGSGLGLAIAKQVIELHCGKIELNSKIDKGTKIRIQF